MTSLYHPIRATMVIVASVAMAVGSVACSDTEPSSETDPQLSDLANRGFREPVRIFDGTSVDTYHANLGICRIQLTVDSAGAVVAQQGDTEVPDANVSLLKQQEEFRHCFEGPSTGR